MKILSYLPLLLFIAGVVFGLLANDLGSSYDPNKYYSYGMSSLGLGISSGFAFIGAAIAYRK